MEEARLESLTIYLAKEGLEKASDCIEDIATLRSFKVTEGEGEGTLYVQTRTSNPPRWGRFFEPPLKRSDFGRVSSAAAVFHTVVDGRAFLLTFGQGRHLLKPASYEERFGLRVTLNSIGADRVRSIDKHTLDTIGRHTRVQASKEATTGEFGLDIEQDLLRAITGSPTDQTLGKTLSGLDALHVVARVELESLPELLSRYLVQFGKDTYKTAFPWVDHMAEMKDAALKEHLDGKMLEALGSGSSDKCWLAVPEPIEWAGIAGFRYGSGARHALVHDIHTNSFLQDHAIEPDAVTTPILKNHHVLAVDGDGSVQHKWPIYRCVYCEVEDAGNTYFLSGAHWYKVASDFVGQVNDFCARLPFHSEELPEYADASEPAYAARVASESKGKYALVDRKLISIGGGHSRVEFCDLFSRDKDLIHIKRYGGAGLLSHLFAQGVVSGQLFVSDEGFRKALNGVLPKTHRLPDFVPRPNPDDFRIVFAVVSSERGKKLTLPFFSRLNIRHAAQNLAGYGYKVELAKIAVADAVAKTKKFSAARHK